MAATFQFEDKQWQSFLKKINTKWKDIKHRKKFSDLVTIVAFKDIIEHFKEQKGPSGKWKQRKEPYKSWIEAKGKGNILQVSGDLRGSLELGEGKTRSNSEGIMLFTKVKYAAKHDQGLDGMPKRQFMWLSPKGMKSLVDQTLKWLSE